MLKIASSLALLAMTIAFADDPFGPNFVKTVDEIQATFSGFKVKETLLTMTPQNRKLMLYTLGNAAAKKRTLLLCNHHGDEQWVAQLCVDFVKYMLWAKDSDATVKSVLKNSAFDVLPIGNPDGFSVAQRHNARDIDLNRNFPFKWGYEEEGTSDGFKGPNPLSEPESKALYDYQMAHKGEWVVILNYHLSYPNSGGDNYILTPWAYSKNQFLSDKEMSAYKPFLPTQEEAPTFKVDTIPHVFYPCSGVHTDWTQNEFGVPSLTMELGHGYDLPTREIYLSQHLKGENLPVFKRFLKGIEASLNSF